VQKEVAIVPVFKVGNHAAMSNSRPISLISNLSKLFEFITHSHILNYIKINPNQHGLDKSKSTVTNLVSFLDFMASVVRGQRQDDGLYFELYNAFDLIPPKLLLHMLS
jgi:hypothetical protein